MPSFESLFGQPARSIQKTCVLLPILHKGMLERFDIRQMSKGQPYSSGSHSHLTLIHSHIGSSFTGDCVLYLQDSPCENLILFGSCGLVQKTSTLDIGSLVSPSEVVDMESFSSLLNKKYNQSRPFLKPDQKLFHALTNKQTVPLHICRNATFGSIALEDKYLKSLKKDHIDVVEMECSAFFGAAQKTKKRAAAIFYVTDTLGQTNPYPQHSLHEDPRVQSAIDAATRLILSCAQHFNL